MTADDLICEGEIFAVFVGLGRFANRFPRFLCSFLLPDRIVPGFSGGRIFKSAGEHVFPTFEERAEEIDLFTLGGELCDGGAADRSNLRMMVLQCV